MVFHEITQSAIDHAVNNPRGIDYGLVDAAETRRILDRLYGYEVSPVLWRRVNRGLSAGRVQSPSIRLIVERERERIAFVVRRLLGHRADDGDGAVVHRRPRRRRRHAGRHRQGLRRRRPARRRRRRARRGARPRRSPTGSAGADFRVRSVEEKPYRSRPKAPFMTSTLQQEGGRKLRLSSSQVMRVAQGLYERGYITYMRTDNVDAVRRGAAGRAGGRSPASTASQFLSPQPKQYTSKVKNAQEAHEAIRPTTPLRSPQPGRGRAERPGAVAVPADLAAHAGLADGRRHRHHRHASASAPRPPTAPTPSSRRPARRSRSPATARCTSSPATRATATATSARRCCRRSPSATPSPSPSLEPHGHATSPPARYTEASLVKRLEELGIGRPSTWASIIQTVQDRGYVWKKGQALVPTWTAFAVVNLLEQHFDELVDYDFTARVENDLDAIAAGERQKDQWLQSFYFGDDDAARPEAAGRGEPRRDRRRGDQHVPARPRPRRRRGRRQAGQVRAVREARRRHGQRARRPHARRADARQGARAARRAEVRRADRRARRAARCSPRTAATGRTCSGARPTTPPPGLDKPKMSSLFKTMMLERITMDEAEALLHAAARRSAPTRPTASRSSPTTAATGRTSRRARTSATSTTRSSCSRSRSTRRCGSSPSRRCSAAAARTWPPRARCASSAPTR